MDIKEVESLVMALPEDERAELTQKLLISLENTSRFLDAPWLKSASEQAKEAQKTPGNLDSEEVKKRHLHFLEGLSGK